MADVEELVAGKYAVMAPVLDERQRRVWLGWRHARWAAAG